MTGSHLSDEAVAAHADGVLRGLPEQRARRHVAECAECATAVRVQREAAFALRAADNPMLPASLLSRLQDVPSSTPLPPPPSALTPDGAAVFPTGAAPARTRGSWLPRLHMTAAFVPEQTGQLSSARADDEAEQNRHGLIARLFRAR